jgi:uncharacterized protein YndB with AHSA1/START domain
MVRRHNRLVSLPLIAVQRVIHADPHTLFELLADPTQHPVIDGSGTVRDSHADNPDRLSLGARFAMDMKIGASYKIVNKVVEFVEDRRIAWRHFNGHVWRYTLQPVEGGTLVREEWDPKQAKNQLFLRIAGVPRRAEAGMRLTLDRLAAEVELAAH